MPNKWLRETIASKLLLAFFSVFILTYLATALVVHTAVRSAVTESELNTLSQLAHLKLSSLEAKFEQLSTNLHAWAKLDVMNDLASGDVDKRLENTLVNLAKDYHLNGELYAFDAAGHLVAASDQLHNLESLPEKWLPQGEVKFVNKHPSPVDGENIVALIAPVTAAFSPNLRLGTIVMTTHWTEVSDALPEQTVLLYHQDAAAPTGPAATGNPSLQAAAAHAETIQLLGSTLSFDLPTATLTELAHQTGKVAIGNQSFLVNNAMQGDSLLSGWEVVMLRDPHALTQTIRGVLQQLVILGLGLTVPLFLIILWLAGRLTAPLRKLTQFVSEISGTHDLSKRLDLRSNDEIGLLAADFNRMAARLEAGSKAHLEVEARLSATINNALDAVVQIDSGGTVTGWNDQAENIFGWTRAEAIGRKLHEMIIPPQYRDEHLRGMQNYLDSGEGRVMDSRIEMVSLHRDGHEFPVELAITNIMVHGQYEFSAFIRDITSKKESEDLIWRQANFDKVTGLPNRHMLHDRLEQEIKKAHRTDLQMGLLFIDLDHFKEINDTLGHDKGDMLLQEASRRITSCVRESDTVARLGGDEFTVILSEVDETKSVERIAQNILKVLADPFQLGDDVVYISASIGITLYPNDASTVEDLLKNADQAMYVAKNQGRNQSSYFTPALQRSAQERRRLTQDLRGALAAGQFMLYFQPIISLADGQIHKAEALLRWQHPERGMLHPSMFIQIAEETGLIHDIGEWVFRESALLVMRWKEHFAPDFQVSVNVSPIQFQAEGIDCHAWGEYLQSIKLGGKHIVIEITEGLLLKATSEVSQKLLQFRDMGIQVAIDDFGTGYSSLSYLNRFDIDYLKIDKSFVDTLDTDANDMALSEAIIVMAHKLGLEVIAEGVESAVQQQLLRKAGCNYAQGYLFSRALAVTEFEEFLEANFHALTHS